MKCWCNATIGSSEPEIKSHVKSCNYYLKRCFFYNCIDRIPPEASENDIRVIFLLMPAHASLDQTSRGCSQRPHQEEDYGEQARFGSSTYGSRRTRTARSVDGNAVHRPIHSRLHGVQQEVLLELRRAESILRGGVLAPVLQALHRKVYQQGIRRTEWQPQMPFQKLQYLYTPARHLRINWKRTHERPRVPMRSEAVQYCLLR